MIPNTFQSHMPSRESIKLTIEEQRFLLAIVFHNRFFYFLLASVLAYSFRYRSLLLATLQPLTQPESGSDGDGSTQ